ncbi:MAG: hypothetical protein H0V70_10275 [Ktedonobacteraceae bacterium]|nr:hypothetical protein [Ktedonobacteraceae bacterium]
MIQPRNPEKIRVDAIQMGIKKAQGNCQQCAESYFELARKHGATEEQIQQALEDAAQMKGRHLNRRDLIKVLAASVVALGTAGVTLKDAHADQFGDWYGTDSNTLSAYGMQQDFYIGRMGQALRNDQSPFFAFDVAAANTAGTQRTFGYWAVHGPTSGARPAGYSDYGWGSAQADAAWRSWGSGPLAPYIYGYTVFGQVEPQTAGWDAGNYGPNRDVVNGFLARLYIITPSTPAVWPGIYITPNNWSQLLDPNFSQNFNTPTHFVLWLSGVDTCGSDLCPPCGNCTTTQPTVHARFQRILNSVYLSNMVPVVWQYWIGDCGCNGDYDVTRQNTNNFQPVITAHPSIMRRPTVKKQPVTFPHKP